MLFSDRKRRSAFTLIEVLVVLGIIVLLVAIAFPVIGRAVANGKRTRTQADMMSIQQALESYAKDHNGQYPQTDGTDTGFAVLARELVGVYGDGFLPNSNSPTPDDPNDPPAWNGTTTYKPGDCVGPLGGPYFVALKESTGQATTVPEYWAQFTSANGPHDGTDGPGIKVGNRKASYIMPDKFRVNGCALLDQDGKPILYFPAHGNPNLAVVSAAVPAPYIAQAASSKFNANDNIHFFIRNDDPTLPNALNRIRVIAGDFGDGTAGGLPNGKIDPGETAVGTGRYLLWAAGPDGFYGVKNKVSTTPPTPSEIAKCDDIILTSP